MAGRTGLSVDDLSLIRPALVHAVAVAKAGAVADPPEPPPDGLRRLLGFRRLQPAALATVRRVLDADDAFRQRVIDAASADELGRAAWVWLTRSPGWEAELEEFATTARLDAESDSEEREVAQLRRALAGAEEAVRRHETDAARAQDAGRRARAELAEERRLRREAEQAKTVALGEATDSRNAREALELRAGATEAELLRVESELNIARAALQEAEAELRTAPLVSEPSIDLDALAQHVAQAALDAAALSGVLADIADELTTERSPTKVTETGTGDGPLMRTSEPRPRARSRRPAAMPPGVWDDAPEAAVHLMRLPRAVVLVDGYNVARTAWSGLSPEQERSRLIAILEELHARMGTEVIVVFDGVQEGGPISGQMSRTVRVRFTAEAVSADDVVRDLIGDFPVHRPVVVVSSDREVADGARARGANAVSSRQFLRALGR